MAKDTDFASVTLLLHCDGTDGSQIITDSSLYGHAVSAFGNAQISTADLRFGKPALLFDGSGDYFTLPDVAALELGSADFVLEFQIKTTTTVSYACPIGRDTGAFTSGAWSLLLNGNGSGSIQLWNASYSTGSPHLSTSASPAINDGNWHHIALVRYGSSWVLYVDGTSRATATWSGSITDVALPIHLGRDPGYSRDFAGRLAQIRLTKGVARYTAAFTPPSAPFPMAGDLVGTTLNASGSPAARLVRAYREDTGALVGSVTSDATTGAYTIPTPISSAHTLNAYPAAGEALPALTLRGVVPV